MADDSHFEERPARWVVGDVVAALALVTVCCLVSLGCDFGLSAGPQAREYGLAEVTFIVGGMMKSRSGAT